MQKVSMLCTLSPQGSKEGGSTRMSRLHGESWAGRGCGLSWGLEEVGDLDAGGGGQAQARKALTHFSTGAVLML